MIRKQNLAPSWRSLSFIARDLITHLAAEELGAGDRFPHLVTPLGSLSGTGRSVLWLDALEYKREAGAHIEPPTRDHHGLVRLRAVSAGMLLSLLGRGSDIREF